jgi:hypothetical protein
MNYWGNNRRQSHRIWLQFGMCRPFISGSFVDMTVRFARLISLKGFSQKG